MAGMTVAQSFRRNTKITITTRPMVRSSVNWTSETLARIVCVRSEAMTISMPAGRAAWSRGSAALMASTVAMTLAPGWRWMASTTAGRSLYQPCRVMSCRPDGRLADVPQPDGGPVAIGEDQVVVVPGLEELVVGLQQVGLVRAVELPLGLVHGRGAERGADLFEVEAGRRDLRRVDLHPDGGVLLARRWSRGRRPASARSSGRRCCWRSR